jgi:16S rRNA (adenine1518-N6/adenine1519-N6)-dimethyltransferase
MRAKKSLGQNFLMHQATAERIAASAKLKPKDTVLEIGPGTGKLTRALLPLVSSVIAIEKDDALTKQLGEVFSKDIKNKKLTLLHEDVRAFSYTKKTPYHIVANIPYYITGEIIRQFLTAKNKPRSMTLLVQKEVAERIARSKKESLLSLSVKVFGTPTYVFTVSRGSFVPAPNVDSAVLHISDIQNPFASHKEEERFFTLLHSGFAHKRKLLVKNLQNIAEQKKLLQAFTASNMEEKARAEDVPLSAWKKLAKELV